MESIGHGGLPVTGICLPAIAPKRLGRPRCVCYSGWVNLYELEPGPEMPEVVRVIVEIPKDSPNKYEYDGKLGVFRLDRALYSPMHYPGDYGFIPGTLAADGDPMDVLVLVNRPTFPGCLLEVRPIGVLNMVDQKELDQKIIGVSPRDPRYSEVHTLDQVAPHTKRELEHFFAIYKELEGRVTQTQGWGGPQEARKVILDSRALYLDRKGAEAAVTKEE
jgi:inorganic pyrophosphatase